ncbi:LysR substrate-binding domain-containing protein [Burkholderia cenocepacia]
MNAAHPLAAKSVIKADDLSQAPFIALNPEDSTRLRLETQLRGLGVVLKPLVETPYSHTVCELALAGVGVGFAHPLVALDFAQRGARGPAVRRRCRVCRRAGVSSGYADVGERARVSPAHADPAGGRPACAGGVVRQEGAGQCAGAGRWRLNRQLLGGPSTDIPMSMRDSPVIRGHAPVQRGIRSLRAFR